MPTPYSLRSSKYLSRSLFWGAAALLLCFEMPSTYAASAGKCEEAQKRYHQLGPELADLRVQKAVNATIQASGFQADVVACELLMPYVTATVEKVGSSYYIGITHSLLEHFTDEEIQAVLGHEIAHIVLGHRAPTFELTHHRAIKYEKEADALSAQWFGQRGMRSVIEVLRLDARRLPKASQRRRALAELNARLKALDIAN
jgi:Peptidase family M48